MRTDATTFHQERLVFGTALARVGRAEEAREIALRVLAEKPEDRDAIDLLRQVDPTAAEASLRELVAADPADVQWTSRLAYTLAELGATAEAVTLLTGFLEHATLDWPVEHALSDLTRIAPAAAYEWMLAPVAGRAFVPDGDTWERVADQLAEAEHLDLAIQGYIRGLTVETEAPDSLIEGLREQAPERVLPLLEMRVAAGANDEFHGALAELYWRAGRYAEAEAAWRRADELDPDDGDWSWILERIAAGADPLD